MRKRRGEDRRRRCFARVEWVQEAGQTELEWAGLYKWAGCLAGAEKGRGKWPKKDRSGKLGFRSKG
jgi:hypothetical protein